MTGNPPTQIVDLGPLDQIIAVHWAGGVGVLLYDTETMSGGSLEASNNYWITYDGAINPTTGLPTQVPVTRGMALEDNGGLAPTDAMLAAGGLSLIRYGATSVQNLGYLGVPPTNAGLGSVYESFDEGPSPKVWFNESLMYDPCQWGDAYIGDAACQALPRQPGDSLTPWAMHQAALATIAALDPDTQRVGAVDTESSLYEWLQNGVIVENALEIAQGILFIDWSKTNAVTINQTSPLNPIARANKITLNNYPSTAALYLATTAWAPSGSGFGPLSPLVPPAVKNTDPRLPANALTFQSIVSMDPVRLVEIPPQSTYTTTVPATALGKIIKVTSGGFVAP